MLNVAIINFTQSGWQYGFSKCHITPIKIVNMKSRPLKWQHTL